MRDQRESLPADLNAAPWAAAVRYRPIRDLIAHLADKWSVLVLFALAQQLERKLRFSELMNRVAGISQRTLTTTLRYLERDGILTRRAYPEVPPRVEYALSERRRRMLAPVEALVSWVQAMARDQRITRRVRPTRPRTLIRED